MNKHFRIGEPAALWVTLSEYISLDNPYILFVFTKSTPGRVVNLIIPMQEDKSNYPERCNLFHIPVEKMFQVSDTGQWSYAIYEQENPDNVDPANAILLEQGIVLISDDDQSGFTGRNSAQNFITRP